MQKRIKKVNKRLDKTFQVINHKYTPKEIEDLWNSKTPHPEFLVLDSQHFHKILTFRESDGHQFADSIELELDALKRWRLKHYQERWMEKKDLQKYYELILNVIKKL